MSSFAVTKLAYWTISRRSNVGFAFYDFENAATKKVAVLIFGIFCTRVFAKGSFRRPSPASLLACCAGKRFAFPQFRTLSGSNPMHRAQTKTVPLRGPFPIQWWAMRDVRVRLAPPASASGLRPSSAALENASRFLSSAPLRVRIPCIGRKQKRSPCEDRFQFSGGR